MKCLNLKLTFATLVLCAAGASAQVRLPGLGPSIKTDVQKVVADFPSQFASLRGEVIAKNPQTVEYASRVQPPGAESCMITQYSSNSRSIYSWQALMLSTEDFEVAAKKYRSLFQQLKGMNVKYVTDSYTLVGHFEEPDDSRKFMISELTVAEAPGPLKKLRVEVYMQFEFPEWRVGVTVFERERDDEERGEVND
ncbi:MAG TPA: hypothetical protein VHK69_02100 [Chitinophagaceae bacterium]|nr:hypothetical protein [Chitinophagaceae bacterium]